MGGVEFTANRLKRLENLGEFSRIVNRPILLRCKTNARAVGAATLVGAAEGGRRGPRCGYQLRNRETGAEHLRLERCNILRIHQRVRDGRHWVLPDEHFLRNERPKVTSHWTHVTVRQLEPCARKCIRELLWILEEPTRNRLVVWIHAQRKIRGEHHGRMALRSVVRIRYGGGCRFIGGDPLMRTGRTLGEFPFVAEQGFKVAVVPRGGRCRPRAFKAAGNGVTSIAGSKAVLPAKAHLLQRCCFWLRSDEFAWISGAVRLAEGVTAGDQRNGFLIVHGHACEGFTDVARGGHRIGFAVRAFGVHIDETHLHGGEWVIEFAVAGVALVGKPLAFTAPVGGVRLPHISAAAAEAEGLESHRLQRNVASEEEEIRP